MKRRKRLGRDERGQGVVEMALVFFILLFLAAGAADTQGPPLHARSAPASVTIQRRATSARISHQLSSSRVAASSESGGRLACALPPPT